MAYTELDLMTDPDALVQLGIDYLEAAIPGFEARPGNVETVLLEANAQIGAEIVEQVAPIDPAIFAGVGELVGVLPFEPTPARGTATVTFIAAAALLYPAGSLIAVPSPTGEPIAFATDADLLAPPSGGDLPVGITALEDGSSANGCFGEAEPIDVVEGVEAIVVADATSGGTDEEESEEYLARLAEAMTILAPRPIIPSDFSILAQQVPGVGRTTTIDLYQPSTGEGGYGTPRGATAQTNVPRCATVVVTNPDGTAPSAGLLDEVGEYLDARREVNFLVYTIPPTYETIDIQATVRAYPGYLPTEVEAAAEAELAAWLAPTNWGALPGGEGWVRDDRVRLYEAIDFLNRADGVNYVESVTMRKGGTGSYTAADVVLTGTVVLPTPGAIAVTVVSGS